MNHTTLKILALRIFKAFVQILLILNLSLKDFLTSNSPDILALCETNLDDWIDSGNFSVGGYLLLMWKDSNIYICGLVVYVNKEGELNDRPDLA